MSEEPADDEGMASENATVIVASKKMLPKSLIPSTTVECSLCDEPCWLGVRDKASADAQGFTLIPVCMDCSKLTMEELLAGERLVTDLPE